MFFPMSWRSSFTVHRIILVLEPVPAFPGDQGAFQDAHGGGHELAGINEVSHDILAFLKALAPLSMPFWRHPGPCRRRCRRRP